MQRRQFLLTAGAWVSLSQVLQAASTETKIKWQSDLKIAYKLCNEHSKPMLIVFGASWCTYCHKLEKETLAEKTIAGLIEREFIPVHLDFDKQAKAAEVLEVQQLPASIVLSKDADLLGQQTGYLKSPAYTRFLQAALAKQAELAPIRAVSHSTKTATKQ